MILPCPVGVQLETADMLVHEISTRDLREELPRSLHVMPD